MVELLASEPPDIIKDYHNRQARELAWAKVVTSHQQMITAAKSTQVFSEGNIYPEFPGSFLDDKPGIIFTGTFRGREEHGYEDKWRTTTSTNVQPPSLYGLRKDHKDTPDQKKGTPVRQVCEANSFE